MVSDGKVEIDDIYELLLDKKYDISVINFILFCFEDVLSKYYEYHSSLYNTVDDFVLKYMNILTNPLEIKLVSNINDKTSSAEYFRKAMKQNDNNGKCGYNLVKGLYVEEINNPQFLCVTRAFCTAKNEIIFLYDNIHRQYFNMPEAFFHELCHTKQTGFSIPWYVMNRKLFERMLKEGQAIHETLFLIRHKEIYFSNLITKSDNKSLTTKQNQQKIFNIIYRQLLSLLGVSFLNDWSTSKEDHYFMTACQKIIDEQGRDTFERLYKDIQSLLLLVDDDLINGIDEIKIDVETKNQSFDIIKKYGSLSPTDSFAQYINSLELEVCELVKDNEASIVDVINNINTIEITDDKQLKSNII